MASAVGAVNRSSRLSVGAAATGGTVSEDGAPETGALGAEADGTGDPGDDRNVPSGMGVGGTRTGSVAARADCPRTTSGVAEIGEDEGGPGGGVVGGSVSLIPRSSASKRSGSMGSGSAIGGMLGPDRATGPRVRPLDLRQSAIRRLSYRQAPLAPFNSAGAPASRFLASHGPTICKTWNLRRGGGLLRRPSSWVAKLLGAKALASRGRPR